MSRHLHILGICGTFMGGVALFAKEAGFKVTGSDENVYPPMSTQLETAGIKLMQGYKPENLKPKPNSVVIGNALSRGNPEVEAVLNSGFGYTSGAEWLARNILKDKWVLAVSGTHGKTTTSSILAWILEYAGLNPGFLIGGVPENFRVSARYTASNFFVIEADEYDTAFFDKRSKFVHYRPRTLLINNIEYDHADIFASIEDIKTQFHNLIRIVPANGLIAYSAQDENVLSTLGMGCWTETETIGEGGKWQANLLKTDGSEFEVMLDNKSQGAVRWQMMGEHNVMNALGAAICARHAGIPLKFSLEALGEFAGVKRRMQLKGVVDGVKVYDDFAHHPTAIKTTLDGLRKNVGDSRIIAVLEPRSNTMKLGVHNKTLVNALSTADCVYIHNLEPAVKISNPYNIKFAEFEIFSDVNSLLKKLLRVAQPGDHILIMSNGGFENIHQRLLDQL